MNGAVATFTGGAARGGRGKKTDAGPAAYGLMICADGAPWQIETPKWALRTFNCLGKAAKLILSNGTGTISAPGFRAGLNVASIRIFAEDRSAVTVAETAAKTYVKGTQASLIALSVLLCCSEEEQTHDVG